ncbi:MAG: polymerase sigma factor FliA, partial [Pseudonocardiales bacterium]|nr:polymerase sigma factor FliA [Pseudonocardiales bacterium]
MTRLTPGLDRSPSCVSTLPDLADALAAALREIRWVAAPPAGPRPDVVPGNGLSGNGVPRNGVPPDGSRPETPQVGPREVGPREVVPPPGDLPRDGPADDPRSAPDEPAAVLWAAYRAAPDRLTRDRLVVHYCPLLRAVVHRTAARLPAHVDVADLVQSGVFGLLEAIDRFDPDRCARFESYAVPRIRGAVLDELRAQDWVPRTIRLRVREAERVREQLAMHLRRTASEREVADALGMPLRELRSNTAARTLSVEQLRSGTDGGSLDMLACAGPDPAAALQEQETRRQLWHAVDQLGERDRLVL